MMWPFFNKSETAKRWPSVSIGDISATWCANYGWTFVDPILQVDCNTYDNDEFHESIVTMLPIAREWISQLASDMLNRVNQYADEAALPTNAHDMQGIDLSKLCTENQIDISYTSDEWADFAINVVITGGEITDVYGGD